MQHQGTIKEKSVGALHGVAPPLTIHPPTADSEHHLVFFFSPDGSVITAIPTPGGVAGLTAGDATR